MTDLCVARFVCCGDTLKKDIKTIYLVVPGFPSISTPFCYHYSCAVKATITPPKQTPSGVYFFDRDPPSALIWSPVK